MSVGNERYYKHKTGFTDGIKYVVRQLVERTMVCVSRERTYPKQQWKSYMDQAVERGEWVQITQEEAEAL
jgi:hypothetical protein